MRNNLALDVLTYITTMTGRAFTGSLRNNPDRKRKKREISIALSKFQPWTWLTLSWASPKLPGQFMNCPYLQMQTKSRGGYHHSVLEGRYLLTHRAPTPAGEEEVLKFGI